MKVRIVPAEDISPIKGLRATDYIYDEVKHMEDTDIIFTEDSDEEIFHRLKAIQERRSGDVGLRALAEEAMNVGLSALESALDELEDLSS